MITAECETKAMASGLIDETSGEERIMVRTRLDGKLVPSVLARLVIVTEILLSELRELRHSIAQ